jgi:hypothetical protein
MNGNLEQSTNNRLIEVDRKIGELEIENEALDRSIRTLLAEHQVTEEQVAVYVSQRGNFKDQDWLTLQQERKRLDDKLKKELEAVVNPLKKKKSQKERHVQPHWLFVR